MAQALRPKVLKKSEDAYGQAMSDYFWGMGGEVFIERDDGFIERDRSLETYFSPYKNWSADERRAMRFARGRVLDIGCGAGRHSLYLQGLGREALGIDISPLAVKTCNLRGLQNARALPIEGISPRLGRFDTILMLGNNFGLLGGYARARKHLRTFHRMTSPHARIMAQTFDPYKTRVPEHLAYHKRNRARGRMPAQLRLRVRYRGLASPWLDYIFVSQEEMARIVKGTGWEIERILQARSPGYVAILTKV